MSAADLKVRAAFRELMDKALETTAPSKDQNDPKRPKIAAVDLDGTILNYDHTIDNDDFGEPISGVIEKLNQLQAEGWKIVIWTVRQESDELKAHLEKHAVPYDFINKHPWTPPHSSPKITADVYIDDRALRFDGNPATYDKIKNTKPWWKKDDDS